MFPLVLVEFGQLSFLDLLLSGSDWKAFPYQNDRHPKAADTVDLYTEATFDGYSGPQSLLSWEAAEFIDGRALARHPALAWVHNGGGIDNYLFGICVVDADFNLIWAARDPRAPVYVRPQSPSYVYQPVLSVAAEYLG